MPMNITHEIFGHTKEAQPVDIFTLSSPAGLTLKVCSYGATITELHTPDRKGDTADVTLGFANLGPYLGAHPSLGCVVGRVANRIANARFRLNKKEYQLHPNNSGHSLHGGKVGLGRRVWKSQQTKVNGVPAVEFTYHSPDMEEGYPGTVDFKAIYLMPDNHTIRLIMEARTDYPTPVNLTNHAYFNFHGAGNGNILDHELTIHADHYTPVDASLIPTGEILSVHETPMDFTHPTAIGTRIAQVPGGYDHNYVLRTGDDPLHPAARVIEATSGRAMEVWTTQPGVQLYTGNFLDGSVTGVGGAYEKHGGLCLETQHFPNAVHHGHFPSIILHPGQHYHHIAEYRFPKPV